MKLGKGREVVAIDLRSRGGGHADGKSSAEFRSGEGEAGWLGGVVIRGGVGLGESGWKHPTRVCVLVRPFCV